jgi:RpiB/LacA/LacB family sugar-phosphate isomerase
VRIAIASDHAGFALKTNLLEFIRQGGHEPVDLGTHGTESVDYPDYAARVGQAIKDRRAERGIMICGSGVGGAVAANKLCGIRAGLCHDIYSARQGVEHDDMNVLVLGGLVIGHLLARELVKAFLGASYTPVERYQRRLNKIGELERKHGLNGG